jgi:hypothetical protein
LSNRYSEPEELVFLFISRDKADFYKRLFEATTDFFYYENIQYNREELKKVINEQSLEIPDPTEYPTMEEYATRVILYGRKSNLNKPIGFQLI